MNLRPLTIFSVLSAFLSTLALLSVLMADKTFTIIDGSFGNLLVDGSVYPLYLGLLSLRLVSLTIAFFISLLLAELLGSKVSVVASIGCVLALWLISLSLSLGEKAVDPLFVMATSFVLVLVFAVAHFFFFLFRKLTHNKWLIIRLLFAGIVGAVGIGATEMALQWMPDKTFGSVLAGAFSYGLQIFILFITSLVFFYVIGAPLKWIVGKAYFETINASFAKKKMFAPDIQKDFFEQKVEVQEKRLTPVVKIEPLVNEEVVAETNNGIPS